MEIRPIRTDKDHRAALAEIATLRPRGGHRIVSAATMMTTHMMVPTMKGSISADPPH